MMGILERADGFRNVNLDYAHVFFLFCWNLRFWNAGNPLYFYVLIVELYISALNLNSITTTSTSLLKFVAGPGAYNPSTLGGGSRSELRSRH